MRLLVTGDFHPDTMTLGVPRFEEVRDAAQETVVAAIDREVDAYLFLGDLVDPDSGGDTMRAIELLQTMALDLSSAGIPFIAIAGNHDVEEDGTGATTLTPLRAIAEVHTSIYVLEAPSIVGLEDQEGNILNIIGLPYPSATSNPRSMAEVASELVKKSNNVPFAVMAHLMIPSAQQGSETTEMPRGREVSFPIAETSGAALRLNGHYHRRQVTPEGIIIPGSLARLTFGEGENKPGFLVVGV